MNDICISIDKESIARLPVVEYSGRIVTIENRTSAIKALKALSLEPVVGFDTETRPSFKKGERHNVSLIQISTATHAFLFRINKFGFIDELREFFENQQVTKIGLSLRDDFLVLHKICPFTPEGFIDLQDYVRQFSIADASLQKIYAIIFGARISKSQRLTNWEADSLSEAQMAYASIDAWACLKIFNYLCQGLFNPESSPYAKPVEPEAL